MAHRTLFLAIVQDCCITFVRAQFQISSLVGLHDGEASSICSIRTPTLGHVHPICTVAGSSCLVLHGIEEIHPTTRVFCRQQGQHLTVELLYPAIESLRRGEGAGVDTMALNVLSLIPGKWVCRPWTEKNHLNDRALASACECVGYAEFEVESRGVLSRPAAVLVLRDRQAVAEIRTLERLKGTMHVASVLLYSTSLPHPLAINMKFQAHASPTLMDS